MFTITINPVMNVVIVNIITHEGNSVNNSYNPVSVMAIPVTSPKIKPTDI